MQLTRIEKENREYFTHICPDKILDDENLVKFGVISDEGDAVTACATAIHENMAVIFWLMTDEGFREQGFASFLLEQVEELIKDMGLTGMEIRLRNSDEDLDVFLADHDFLVGEDSRLYSVPIEDIVYGREMDMILDTAEDDHKTQRFPDDAAAKQKLIERICHDNGLDPVIFDGISSVYSVYYSEDGKKIKGALCVSEYGDEDLYVNYLISKGSVDCIRGLIRAMYIALTMTDKTSGKLWFTDRNESAISLIERLTETDREEYMVPGHSYAVKLFM